MAIPINKTSIISYIPQPYFKDGTTTVTATGGTSSFENGDGMLDPDLTNYATAVLSSGNQTCTLLVEWESGPNSVVGKNRTIALLGCSLRTYEDDGGGSPDLDTELSEPISAILEFSYNGSLTGTEMVGFSHSSNNDIKNFDAEPMPGVLSGGQTTIACTGSSTFPNPNDEGVKITIGRTADSDTTERPHATVVIGYVFVGVDLEVDTDPTSFAWRLGLDNERFTSRSGGTINSDSAVTRYVSGEFYRLDAKEIMGAVVTGATDQVDNYSYNPNFYDMTKINTSLPVLFLPYHQSAELDEFGSLGDDAIERMNRVARQNFFAVYGFLDEDLEFQVGAYNEGLNTEYRARFRIRETR